MNLEIVSLIVGIISIILAVFSMVLSYLFYKASQKDSMKISSMVSSVKDSIKVLESDTNKLLNKAFSIIESNSNAMQSKLFGNNNINDSEPSVDFLILQLIAKERSIKISDMVVKLGLEENMIEKVVEKLLYQNIVIKVDDIIQLRNKEIKGVSLVAFSGTTNNEKK